jgi:DNA-binding response OmpR family regulator
MPKVLLIEDDETMISLLRTLLQLEGYEAIRLNHTITPQDVLEAVRREKPALILLDVYLRNMNGFDLLKCLREDPETRQARILMSSGTDFKGQCLEQGADDFILKPYMPNELMNKIRLTLEDQEQS